MAIYIFIVSFPSKYGGSFHNTSRFRIKSSIIHHFPRILHSFRKLPCRPSGRFCARAKISTASCQRFTTLRTLWQSMESHSITSEMHLQDASPGFFGHQTGKLVDPYWSACWSGSWPSGHKKRDNWITCRPWFFFCPQAPTESLKTWENWPRYTDCSNTSWDSNRFKIFKTKICHPNQSWHQGKALDDSMACRRPSCWSSLFKHHVVEKCNWRNESVGVAFWSEHTGIRLVVLQPLPQRYNKC